MTITQPKGIVFQGKYFSDLKSNNDVYPNESVTINNTQQTSNMILINNSIDTSVIDGNTLKKDEEEYTIFFNMELYNENYNFSGSGASRTGAEVDVVLEIYSNATKIYTSPAIPVSAATINLQGQITKVGYGSYSYSFKYPKGITPDENITLRIKTLGTWSISTTSPPNTTTFEDVVKGNVWLTLSAGKSTEYPFRYLDLEVDKILNAVNLNYNTSYYLSDSTRAEIEDILAPEYTFQSYTAWDALERLANFVHAIPEIGIKDFSEVSFRFLDDDPDIDLNDYTFTDETQAIIFGDYNAGYEINAVNTIEEDSLDNAKVEPYNGGWMTVRINNDNVAQLVEDNAAFKTRQRIFKIYKMFVKGITVITTDSNGNNPINLSSNVGTDYWDISDLVVEKQRWDTFENGTANINDSERRLRNTKGNHIYYVQGSNFIQGLAYKTQTLSDFIAAGVAARALMETVMKAAAIFLFDNQDIYPNHRVKLATSGNGEVAILGSHDVFRGVLAQIHYAPMANMRSTVYKHNAFSLGIDTIKFSNEQDRLNDTLNLGEYNRKTINKLGNTMFTISGRTKEYNNIPKLGYKTLDGKIVLNRNINLNKKLVTYDLELSENFLNQSNYVGVNSAYRQYEVPSDNIVHRQDKYQEFILATMNKTPLLPTETNFQLYGKRMFVENFQILNTGYIQNPISYGKMIITKELNSDDPENIAVFDMPINGISLGTTINLQLEMNDNFSAGPRVEDDKMQTNGITLKLPGFSLQNYTRYTNTFGQIYSFNLQLRQRGRVNNTEVDANIYPVFSESETTTFNDVLFELGRVNIDKDAREKYGLNIQASVLSADPNIFIYPGFAKYSALIRDKSNMELGFALLENDYIPTVNDLTIDTKKSKILTTADYNSGYTIQDSVYGLTYSSVKIAGGSKISGYAVFEATTNELIMVVKNPVDRTGQGNTTYTFPTVWLVHKKSLNTYMYPGNPVQYTVSFEENGGTIVDNQVIFSGGFATQPLISRENYTFDGWYTDLFYNNLFSFNTPITSNITLYAKWTSLVPSNNYWVRVYTNIYQQNLFPRISGYSCPSDYTVCLPDANNYGVGFTVNISPVRDCNPDIEFCIFDEQDNTISICPAQQYRVQSS
jgi:uncharacterized repeat protein (TIGR02543 family)